MALLLFMNKPSDFGLTIGNKYGCYLRKDVNFCKKQKKY